MRQIIFDTETTGMKISDGNRVIEIGCVELYSRKLTGNHYHQYINPGRDSEEGALEVHGLTAEFLADKPLFGDIAEAFLAFVEGAELIAHNAAFDLAFLNHELGMAIPGFTSLEDHCRVVDSLAIARSKHPGSRHSLDALCRRYGVDNSGRELHGALLDAELLAEVYLLMTGGQTGLSFGSGSESSGRESAEPVQAVTAELELPVIKASDDELEQHRQYLQFLDKKSNGNCLWNRQSEQQTADQALGNSAKL